jgi:YbbR domain-containing protein
MVDTKWGEKLNLAAWLVADSLRRFFLENALLKLISVVIALFLWYSLSIEEQRSRTLENVLLKVLNTRAETVITQAPLKVVDLRLRGPRGVVMGLEPEAVSVIVDASALAPGNHTIWLGPDNIRVPASVEVLRIDPPSLPVVIERKVTRRVSVKAEVDPASIPPNRMVVNETVNPPEVQITGPASKVEALAEVPTEPIRLAEANSEVTAMARIRLTDQASAVTPDTVTVSIMLDAIAEKNVPGVNLSLPPRVQWVSTRKVNLTLRGPISLLNQIEANDLKASFAIDDLPRGKHEITPTITLAEAYRNQVTVASIEPSTVGLQLR